MHLVVLGSINADLFIELDRLPQPGETIAGRNAAVLPGGKGANQAAAAARQGCPTSFIGRLGTDAFAGKLREALAATGCDLGGLHIVDGPTGQAWILLQSQGENSIVLVPGANHSWGPLDKQTLNQIRTAGCLLLQREIPESVNLEAARAAYDAGVPVIIDAGGADGEISPDLLRCLTVLSPNETELARLTGLPTNNQEQVGVAAQSLLNNGVKRVLVKLGSRGSLLMTNNQPPIRQGIFSVPVVDTTGAGDCFTATYAVGLMSNLPEPERLCRAAAAAALCIQQKGAMPAMPSLDAINRLVASTSPHGA